MKKITILSLGRKKGLVQIEEASKQKDTTAKKVVDIVGTPPHNIIQGDNIEFQQQANKVGMEDITISENGNVVEYSYLGNPIKLIFSDGNIIDECGLSDDDIHDNLLQELGLGQKEVKTRGNSGVHIPANISVLLGLQDSQHVLRAVHFDENTSGYTGYVLSLEDDIIDSQKINLDDVLEGKDFPRVKKIKIENFYFKLYEILKYQSGNK